MKYLYRKTPMTFEGHNIRACSPSCRLLSLQLQFPCIKLFLQFLAFWLNPDTVLHVTDPVDHTRRKIRRYLSTVADPNRSGTLFLKKELEYLISVTDTTYKKLFALLT
jgi:hypothetical protein